MTGCRSNCRCDGGCCYMPDCTVSFCFKEFIYVYCYRKDFMTLNFLYIFIYYSIIVLWVNNALIPSFALLLNIDVLMIDVSCVDSVQDLENAWCQNVAGQFENKVVHRNFTCCVHFFLIFIFFACLSLCFCDPGLCDMSSCTGTWVECLVGTL